MTGAAQGTRKQAQAESDRRKWRLDKFNQKEAGMKKEAKQSLLLVVVAVAGLAMVGIAASAAQAQNRQEVAQAGEKATGKGVIKGVNKTDRQIQITHEAIPALKWPGMTMAFKVAPNVDIEGLAPGAKITFTLSKAPQGGYVIEQIQRAE
jgi:Cu(I)/Ag(I) efflux system membrane fusion protein